MNILCPRTVVRIERGPERLRLHLECGHVRCWPFDAKFGADVGQKRTCIECGRAAEQKAAEAAA